MPGHDLVALWETHCRHEFETRDVDATMATMVGEPYVNHVPTMTGGVGHDELKRFYRYHFIGENPPDTELRPISRTVGADQIVDDFRLGLRADANGSVPDAELRRVVPDQLRCPRRDEERQEIAKIDGYVELRHDGKRERPHPSPLAQLTESLPKEQSGRNQEAVSELGVSILHYHWHRERECKRGERAGQW